MKLLTICLFAFSFVEIMTARSKNDARCIKANVWQNLNDSQKEIEPTACTSIYKSCCYIHFSMNYMKDLKVETKFCASLSGFVDDRKAYFKSLLEDEMQQFANYTYYSKHKYEEIGRQFNYLYNDSYCYFPPPSSNKNYSDYLYKNCGKFDKNGTCVEEKDTVKFNQFVAQFYEHFLSTYCSKRSGDDKCILYSGSMGNNLMVRPLLVDLKGYLDIDAKEDAKEENRRLRRLDGDEDDETTDDNVGNIEAEDQIVYRWSSSEQCPFSKNITVEVICPSNYQYSSYISISLFLTLIVLLITLF